MKVTNKELAEIFGASVPSTVMEMVEDWELADDTEKEGALLYLRAIAPLWTDMRVQVMWKSVLSFERARTDDGEKYDDLSTERQAQMQATMAQLFSRAIEALEMHYTFVPRKDGQ